MCRLCFKRFNNKDYFNKHIWENHQKNPEFLQRMDKILDSPDGIEAAEVINDPAPGITQQNSM